MIESLGDLQGVEIVVRQMAFVNFGHVLDDGLRLVDAVLTEEPSGGFWNHPIVS